MGADRVMLRRWRDAWWVFEGCFRRHSGTPLLEVVELKWMSRKVNKREDEGNDVSMLRFSWRKHRRRVFFYDLWFVEHKKFSKANPVQRRFKRLTESGVSVR